MMPEARERGRWRRRPLVAAALLVAALIGHQVMTSADWSGIALPLIGAALP